MAIVNVLLIFLFEYYSLRYDYFGFLVMFMALKIPLHLFTQSYALEFYFGHPIYGYSRRSHKNFAEAKFFPGRRECRKIFYIIQSYGPHGGWNKVIITGMLSWCDQRHYLGSYGPFTRTLWWFTEGRSLQHLFRNTTFLLQDI